MIHIFKSNATDAPPLPKGYRQYTGTGKMRDACPGCCVSTGRGNGPRSDPPSPRGSALATSRFTASHSTEAPHCADVQCGSLLETDGTCAYCASNREAETYRPPPMVPCWTCNYCGHKLPRMVRRSQIEMIASRAGFSSVVDYLLNL